MSIYVIASVGTAHSPARLGYLMRPDASGHFASLTVGCDYARLNPAVAAFATRAEAQRAKADADVRLQGHFLRVLRLRTRKDGHLYTA